MKAIGPIADVLYIDDQGQEYSVPAMDPEERERQYARWKQAVPLYLSRVGRPLR